jgi:hypothetical protein
MASDTLVEIEKLQDELATAREILIIFTRPVNWKDVDAAWPKCSYCGRYTRSGSYNNIKHDATCPITRALAWLKQHTDDSASDGE